MSAEGTPTTPASSKIERLGLAQDPSVLKNARNYNLPISRNRRHPLGGRHLDLFRGRRGLGDGWAVLHTAKSEQMLKARTYGIVIVKRPIIGMFKIYLSNNVFETYRVMLYLRALIYLMV